MKVVSFDGNAFAPTYTATITGSERMRLPGTKAISVERPGTFPVLSGVEYKSLKVPLGIAIEDDTSIEAARLELLQWFKPGDGTSRRLVVSDDNGQNLRYRDCVCESLDAMPKSAGHIFVVRLRVDKDYRWRAVTDDEETWNITATGQTTAVTNAGEDEAYPVLDIKPTSTHVAGYDNKRWVCIFWYCDESVFNYPIQIDMPDLTGKCQGDGDDVRVFVDGTETYRWIDGTIPTDFYIWINTWFMAGRQATLAHAIASGDPAETIDVNEDITWWGASGIIYIQNAATEYEVFTYESKNDGLRRFLGVTRAQKGTTARNFAVDDAAYWVQHDVWVMYGNTAAEAPWMYDDIEPAFDLLSSDNDHWVWSLVPPHDDGCFGEDDGYRTMQWIWELFSGYSGWPYGGEYGTVEDPWEVAGIRALISSIPPRPGLPVVNISTGHYILFNPCGITWCYVMGHSLKDYTGADWYANLRASEIGGSNYLDWEYFATIPEPTVSSPSWDDWDITYDLAANYPGKHFRWMDFLLWLDGAAGDLARCEMYHCYLAFNTAYTPEVMVFGESGNYDLECTITNETTGDAIKVTYKMEIDDTLRVDTANKVVTDLVDGSVQMQAREVLGDVRSQWLPLALGPNTLRYDAAGTGNVTVTVTWIKRYLL